MNRDNNEFNSTREIGILFNTNSRFSVLVDGTWRIRDLETKVL